MIETALLCLALNIYYEARGESVVGQQAVALVTWNRAQRDAKNVCPVVTDPKQFSWTTKGLKKVKGGYQLKAGWKPKEKDAWKSAVFTARLTLRGKLGDFTKGSTHYHATYVAPKWANSMKLTHAIGRHLFYRYA